MRRNICVALSLTCVLGASQVSATVRILDTTPEISALIAKGTAHEEKKQYDQAIFDFSEALLLKPTPLVAAELYGLRGSEHVFKGDFESAKADAEEAIRLAPTNAVAHARLAKRMLVTSSVPDSERLRLADWYSRRAMELAPENEEARETRLKIEKLASAKE